MDLAERTQENIDLMLTDIKNKLQLVNPDIIRAENYSTDQYDDIRDIYELVMSKSTVTVNEIEAVLAELGSLRIG